MNLRTKLNDIIRKQGNKLPRLSVNKRNIGIGDILTSEVDGTSLMTLAGAMIPLYPFVVLGHQINDIPVVLGLSIPCGYSMYIGSNYVFPKKNESRN